MIPNTIIFREPGLRAELRLPIGHRFAVVMPTGVLVIEAIKRPRKYVIVPENLVERPVYPLMVIVIPTEKAFSWAAIQGNQAAMLVATALAKSAQDPRPAPPVSRIIQP